MPQQYRNTEPIVYSSSEDGDSYSPCQQQQQQRASSRYTPEVSPHRLAASFSDLGLSPSQQKRQPRTTPPQRRVSPLTKKPRFRPTKPRTRFATDDRFVPARSYGSPGMTSKYGTRQTPPKPERASSTILCDSAFDSVAMERSPLSDKTPSPKGVYKGPSPYQVAVAGAIGVQLAGTVGGRRRYARVLQTTPPMQQLAGAGPAEHEPARYAPGAVVVAARKARVISTVPVRVLDAPGIVDDFYLNVVDWGLANMLAIGLDRVLYTWDAKTASIGTFPMDSVVTAVRWCVASPSVVAVASGPGTVRICEVRTMNVLRTFEASADKTRVAALAWHRSVVATGSRAGAIAFHDVRLREHKMAELPTAHAGHVCGFAWREDGRFLASGGDDGFVRVWDMRSPRAPTLLFAGQHRNKAAVKALAWSPVDRGLLATGGGAADMCIRLWNPRSGKKAGGVDTGGQVTGLHWAGNGSELVSCGSSGTMWGNGIVTVWRYPELSRLAEWQVHESRVLSSTLSPDGTTVATVSRDENLKFWEALEKLKKRKKSRGKIMEMMIR